MSKTYLPYDPDQQLLLPAALREWLPEDHLAYFISDIADQLDLSEITARYEGERRGGPPYRLPRIKYRVTLFPHHLGLSQGSPGSAVGAVPAGADVLPAGGTGEVGPRGAGRHQGEGERIEAQGDELQAYEGEGSAVAG